MSSNRKLRAFVVAAMALAATLALAACGGDDEVGGGSDQPTEVATTGPVERRAQYLELGRLHRQGRGQHDRRVRGQVPGDHGQLHRGRQRQRRVLRQAPASATGGRVRRSRHLRRHRLDGEADVRPRLPAGDQPRGHAERARRTSSTASRSPPFDPERTFSVPWQVGPRRPDRQHEAGAGHPLGQRPVRPQVQGQGHGAHRDARHRAADDAGRRGRSDGGDDGGLAGADRRAQGGLASRVSFDASPATTTSRT